MRTTVRIDDDVLEAARSLARHQRRSLGEVLSDLARRGLGPRPGEKRKPGGFPVFDVEPCARPITPEMVAEAGDEVSP